MSGTETKIATMGLDGTPKGTLSVSNIDKPYGEKSAPVVSIGISLKGDDSDPDWKVHIPYTQLDEVIAALNEAKSRFGA